MSSEWHLLGINANAFEIFLCIFVVLSAIYWILCISFSPFCLTPKTTTKNKKRCWRLLPSFPLLNNICGIIDVFHGNVKSLIYCIFKNCKQSLQTILYNLVNIQVVEEANVFAFEKMEKNDFCLPQPISRGQQCSTDRSLSLLIASLEWR